MSSISKKIFIESSFFISFLDRGNVNHAKAVEIFNFIAHNRYKAYTLSFVLLQTIVAIERDLGSSLANEFLRTIIESKIEVLYISKADLIAASKYLKMNSSHIIYFQNVIKAIVMEKNGVSSILTFDLWPKIMSTNVSNLIR